MNARRLGYTLAERREGWLRLTEAAFLLPQIGENPIEEEVAMRYEKVTGRSSKSGPSYAPNMTHEWRSIRSQILTEGRIFGADAPLKVTIGSTVYSLYSREGALSVRRQLFGNNPTFNETAKDRRNRIDRESREARIAAAIEASADQFLDESDDFRADPG